MGSILIEVVQFPVSEQREVQGNVEDVRIDTLVGLHKVARPVRGFEILVVEGSQVIFCLDTRAFWQGYTKKQCVLEKVDPVAEPHVELVLTDFVYEFSLPVVERHFQFIAAKNKRSIHVSKLEADWDTQVVVPDFFAHCLTFVIDETNVSESAACKPSKLFRLIKIGQYLQVDDG